MTRSYRNLWPRLVSWDHLVSSYRKCRRRKRYKQAAMQFHFHWESNLRRLQCDLVDQSWQPGRYYNFRIHDPKPRLISAAPFRDRVVHHAVVGVLEPIFERSFIFDSYACRRGKGTHRAIRRAKYYANRHAWCLKTDIVKFFPNVDLEILFELLGRRIKDTAVMNLIRQILDSGVGVLASEQVPQWFPGDDLFATLRPRGLPIGNLTSQFFANVMLNPIDHRIKEEFRVPGYVRYADDLLLFADCKEQLWEIRDQLVSALAQLRLKLHPQKTVVVQTGGGFNFLGFRIFPQSVRLSQRSIRRFAAKSRQWEWEFKTGQKSIYQIKEGIRSWLAHANHGNSHGIRKEIFNRLRFKRRARLWRWGDG